MKRAFGFFLRLFMAFVAAKLILGRLEADTPVFLLGLTLLLVANAYFFDFLEYCGPGGWRRQARSASEAKAESPGSLKET